MELHQLWDKVLGEIELQISRPNFATWLKNSHIITKADSLITIGLPNNFAKGWVEKKYATLILSTLRSLDDSIKKVDFIIHTPHVKLLPSVYEKNSHYHSDNQQMFYEFKIDPETNLNPQYTLNTYAVGSSNEMAHAAVMGVVKKPGLKYNPLFIYGGVGVGKTHLIQAAGNEIRKMYLGKVKVLYVSSEKFTNDVVWAMRNERMNTTKNKYRDIDVLIIDDIQFIGGKPRTEEEFFHTFNALYEQNKQIILSSDRSPRFIPILEDRLSSRFEGGMTIDIGYPDFELKSAVLRNKLDERGISLPDDIITLIATKTEKSLRELEGVLNKILFFKEVKKSEITPKIINEIISNTLKKPSKTINPTELIKTVATFYEISTNDLIGRSRKQEIVEPRQIAIFLLRETLGLSYPFIAEKLGKRDHTTAIYAYEKIKKEMEKNQTLHQKISIIKEMINKENTH